MARPVVKPGAKGKGGAKKSTLPRTLMLSLGLFAIVYVATMEEAKPARRSTKKRPKAAAAGAPSIVTEADYTAKFSPLTEKPADAFRPAVFRPKIDVATAVVKPVRDGVVPTIGEGGDWIYTGLATLDGAVTGLLENRSTGEGAFVRPDEEWKGNRIVSVTERFLVLRDAKGELRTVKVGGPEEAPRPVEGELKPLQPPALQGAIGNIAVTPLPAATAELAPADAATTRQGRRRRRNRQGSPDAN